MYCVYIKAGTRTKETKMSYNEQIQDIQAMGRKLWEENKYENARAVYETLFSFNLSPLDKAKLLANIAQLYKEEGKKDDAINKAEEAITIIDENELYRSYEGSHLRGYLNGFINRLENRCIWDIRYKPGIPLGMNLSMPYSLRAYLSICIICTGIANVVVSQYSFYKLEIILPNENIIINISPIIGWIIGWFVYRSFVSIYIYQLTDLLIYFFNISIEKALARTVDILTLCAILYLIFLRSLFDSLLTKLLWIFVVFLYVFIRIYLILKSERYARQIKKRGLIIK